MGQLRRALRGLRYLGWFVQSAALLTWYRCLFSGLKVGRSVSLGHGVYLNVQTDGRLRIGSRTSILAGSELVAGGEISVGENAHIGRGAVIVAHDRIRIGENALIAEYVTIRDQDHITLAAGKSYGAQGHRTAAIEIGANVWLGSKVTVLKGVSIGDGCVVGANSVVVHDLPPRSVCVGAPARPIKFLNDTLA